MGGFVFANSINGRGGSPSSDDFGSFLTPITGPDGSSNPPDGTVLNSIAVLGPLNSASAPGYADVIVQTSGLPGVWIGQLDLIPGTGVEATASMGIPGLSGNTAVIGYYNSGVFPNGAVFACVRDLNGNWTIQQRLLPLDGAPQGNFGVACAVFGNIAVVCSTVGSGPACYVFVRAGNTWTQVQQFQPSDIGVSDSLSIGAITGNQLFLSAIDQAGNKGAVYVFTLVAGQYQQVQKIVGAAANDFFGISVACDSQTLVIGGGFSTTGKAYVYKSAGGGTWGLLTTLVGSDSVNGDQFGYGVAVNGTLMAIGARAATVGGQTFAGAAYVFQFIGGTWTQTQKLTAPTPVTLTYFGSATADIAGSPSWIAVGAAAFGNASVEGAVFFFKGPAIAPLTDPFVTLTMKGEKVYA
jgi:hypothetical protein